MVNQRRKISNSTLKIEILQSLNGMDKYIAKGIETKLDIVVADEKNKVYVNF